MSSSLRSSFPTLIFAAGGERQREIEWQKRQQEQPSCHIVHTSSQSPQEQRMMGEIETPSQETAGRGQGRVVFLIWMAGGKLHWPRGVAPAQTILGTLVRPLRDGPIQRRSFRAAHHGSTVLRLCCVPCLAHPAVQVRTPTTPSFSFPTIPTISVISSSCPQVTRYSQPAACMHACVQGMAHCDVPGVEY